MHPKFNIESPRSAKFKEKLKSENELMAHNEYTTKIDSMDNYFKDLVLNKRSPTTKKIIPITTNIYKFNVYELPWYEYTNGTYLYEILMTKRPISTL